MDSDRILVLDNGNIAEFGHPADLIKNPAGALSQMVGAHGEVG